MRTEEQVRPLSTYMEHKLHANRNRVCTFTEQTDRSGCGACRMAKVY
jgi:hypothetical protein